MPPASLALQSSSNAARTNPFQGSEGEPRMQESLDMKGVIRVRALLGCNTLMQWFIAGVVLSRASTL